MKRRLLVFALLLLSLCALLLSCKKEPDVIIKTQSITIIGDEIKTSQSNDSKYVIVSQSGDGVWEYQLKYTVAPDDATDKGVNFIHEDNPSLTVSDEGFVTYIAASGGMPSAIIKIMAKDGSLASDTITLYFV